jgi:hypothetical protein
MTTRGLVELRMLFDSKSGDGRRVNTSGGCNGVSRMASIKHSEDGDLFGRSEGFHDDSDRK